MSENIFSTKSKQDLMQIVREFKLIPIGKAQKMRKHELADFLAQEMKQSSDTTSSSIRSSQSEGQADSKIESTNVSDDKRSTKIEETKVAKEVSKAAEETEATKKRETTKAPRGRRRKTSVTDTKPEEKVQDSKASEVTVDSQEDSPKVQDDKSINENATKALDETPSDESDESKEESIKTESDITSSDHAPKTPVRKTNNRRNRYERNKNQNKTDVAPASSENVIATTEFIAKPRPSKTRVALHSTGTETTANENENTETKKVEAEQIISEGVLELMPDGYGFLRHQNYIQGPDDVYVSAQLIRRMNLRAGDFIKGKIRNKRDQDRYQALSFVEEINGQSPDKMMHRQNFERLTPIYPQEKFVLETERNELSTRIIDLFSPIGKGQRGMIVSPPKAGKTILLQKIANAISINNPQVKLIVLLIDERPEEVTDMQRRINGEVVYSTFDKTPENHVKITELVLERAKRLVEMGQDVVILLDSMTRMARAYNLTITPTGRTLSGGLDPGALHHPKRFFGAARNIENGGSLTIIATALVETGSRMDEVIFEEFKGTGNMEVLLDRKLSEKRIFPAIDINRSSTRREELLLNRSELESVWGVRKAFGQLDTSNVTELIISLLLKTKDNEHLIDSLKISLQDKLTIDRLDTNGDQNNNSNNSNMNSNNGIASNRTVKTF